MNIQPPSPHWGPEEPSSSASSSKPQEKSSSSLLKSLFNKAISTLRRYSLQERFFQVKVYTVGASTILWKNVKDFASNFFQKPAKAAPHSDISLSRPHGETLAQKKTDTKNELLIKQELGLLSLEFNPLNNLIPEKNYEDTLERLVSILKDDAHHPDFIKCLPEVEAFIHTLNASPLLEEARKKIDIPTKGELLLLYFEAFPVG